MWAGEFTEEIAGEICMRLANGDSLLQACKDLGIPTRWHVYRAIETNAHSFADNYARAREWQGESDADDMTVVRKKVEDGELGHAEGRVVMDALKWTAGRRRPLKYGIPAALMASNGDGTIVVVNAPESE